jgi:hypothetical protein
MYVDSTIEKAAKELAAARQALSKSEQALAALAVSTEPTTDLQAELRRVEDISTQTQAYQRVIVAQKAQVAELEGKLVLLRGPAIRRQIAEVKSEGDAILDDIASHLWAIVKLGEAAPDIQKRIGGLKAELGEQYFLNEQVNNLAAARETAAIFLQNMGRCSIGMGPMGLVITPALTPEQKVARDKADAANCARINAENKRANKMRAFQLTGRRDDDEW